jgi:hypothetical protein
LALSEFKTLRRIWVPLTVLRHSSGMVKSFQKGAVSAFPRAMEGRAAKRERLLNTFDLARGRETTKSLEFAPRQGATPSDRELPSQSPND